MSEKVTAVCPECDETIDVGADPMLYEIIPCSCGVELEVAGIDPVILELAPEVEEDWGE